MDWKVACVYFERCIWFPSGPVARVRNALTGDSNVVECECECEWLRLLAMWYRVRTFSCFAALGCGDHGLALALPFFRYIFPPFIYRLRRAYALPGALLDPDQGVHVHSILPSCPLWDFGSHICVHPASGSVLNLGKWIHRLQLPGRWYYPFTSTSRSVQLDVIMQQRHGMASS